jgi:AraC family transcriptional regulator
MRNIVATTGGLAPWQKRRIAEVLSGNLARRIRLPELAQLCGLSKSHFARSFRTSFGVSAHQWLVRRRVERAKDLLVHTRDALADIAIQVGFGDQATFTRTFGRLVGTSPGRWRRYHSVIGAHRMAEAHYGIHGEWEGA